MYVVLSSGFLDSDEAMQLALSFQTLHFIFDFEHPMSNASLIYVTKVVSGSSSLIPMLSAMHYDS